MSLNVKLTRCTTEPIMAIEEPASQCYQSTPNPNGKITKRCYNSGHMSVLEHLNFTWHISGVSRALLAQLTRHRTGVAFSVQSQRYCSMEGAEYVVPPSIAHNAQASRIFRSAIYSIMSTYYELSKIVPLEDARFILPNACGTILTCTMNLREFAHFCNERLCSRAQWEIRKMCQEMVRTVNEATDNAFDYMLVPKCKANANYPFCIETECCGLSPRLSDIYQPLKGDTPNDRASH